MIEGTLNLNMKPQRLMVRVAFVSLLIASMVVVGSAGAAGTEDNESHRSSVTTVEDGVPVPVPVAPPRKLSKNSKASKDDTAVSEEVQDLLRLLVFGTAVDLNRFRMEQSSFEDTVVENNYEEYTCAGCVALLTLGRKKPRDEQTEFCQEVILEVLSKIDSNPLFFATVFPVVRNVLRAECSALFQCSATPTMCCQSQGACLN